MANSGNTAAVSSLEIDLDLAVLSQTKQTVFTSGIDAWGCMVVFMIQIPYKRENQ